MAIHDIRQERPDYAEVEQRATLRGLFNDLANEISSLFRQEVALMRAETTESITHARSGISWMAAGGVIAFAAVIVLLMAAVYGLSELMHPGWAALIVGVVALVVGLIALSVGRNHLKAKNMMPSRTVESLRRDANTVARRAP
jgi:hypothetical protein